MTSHDMDVVELVIHPCVRVRISVFDLFSPAPSVGWVVDETCSHPLDAPDCRGAGLPSQACSYLIYHRFFVEKQRIAIVSI